MDPATTLSLARRVACLAELSHRQLQPPITGPTPAAVQTCRAQTRCIESWNGQAETSSLYCARSLFKHCNTPYRRFFRNICLEYILLNEASQCGGLYRAQETQPTVQK